MTDDEWPGAEEMRAQLTAQLAVEARFPGWQIVHTTIERWVRYVEIPAGHFYAVHDRLGERPLIAAELDQLACLLEQRQREIHAEEQWIVRSDLRGILPHIRRWR